MESVWRVLSFSVKRFTVKEIIPLKKELDKYLEEDKFICFDFCKVEYIDNVMVTTIANLVKKLQKSNGDLKIVNTKSNVTQKFVSVNLHRLISIS